jgi:hypothetical protein
VLGDVLDHVMTMADRWEQAPLPPPSTRLLKDFASYCAFRDRFSCAAIDTKSGSWRMRAGYTDPVTDHRQLPSTYIRRHPFRG